MDDKVLYDKISACWMGKNIGGTLGAPTEGKKEKLSITEFPNLGDNGPVPNDDLDLQLLNLHVIEQRGLYVSTNDFSEEWVEHVFFPYDEYGYALTNIRKGMVYPLSGYYNNPFVNCMGSPIRSELWASIAPGRPKIAAYYAYQDAMVDHVGGEGVYGEVFFATLESLAYIKTNLIDLINEALSYIPESCRSAKAVRDTLEWYMSGVAYDDIREYILQKHGNDNFTDAPQNIAFTIAALLYGKDFKDCVLKAINLGYDTDCTTATAGAIYGILNGTKGIPNDWAEAIDERIIVSKEVCGFNPPKTISELADRTMNIMKQLKLAKDEEFSIEWLTNFNQQIYYLPNGIHNSLRVSVICENGSLCINGCKKRLNVEVRNNTFGTWRFNLKIASLGNCETHTSEIVELKAGDTVIIPFNITVVETENMVASYTISLIRMIADYPWKKYDINFVLPVASKWTVDGKTVFSEAGLVDFTGEGIHHADTHLYLNETRKIKLICAGTEMVRVKLDGNIIIENNELTDYMPAYHRGPRQLQTTLELKAGKHKVEVMVKSKKEKCRIMFLPVSSFEYHNMYFIDCSFDK